MQTIEKPRSEKPRSDIYANVAFAMRRSGATLRQIAEKLDRSQERVRQILLESYGSTEYELISTEQLRKRLGLSRPRVMELYHSNVITPKREWKTNGVCYLLWSPDTVRKADIHLNTGMLCKRCNCPIPKNRRVFCSTECYLQNHQYRYKNVAAKKRHLESIKRYRRKKRILAKAAIAGV